ncbi:MAG: hypothetical protein N2323_05445 [candidate division WOR-3 bacterium]|nr:hypothetical protein [candidate division WOR-3 bacterium]MCX7837383.1 hypothetical protein [candidate division WOR-3 bacterium]MDW8114002.1 hypothetical protein [candidate division WOR-3 bacterium]
MANKIRKHFLAFGWNYQKRTYKLLRKMRVSDLKNWIKKGGI